MSHFARSGQSGFHIKFSTGYTLSVQFGPGNYCEKRDSHWDSPKNMESWQSPDAEIAVFSPNGSMIDLGGDTVKGWITPTQVSKLIALLNIEPVDISEWINNV